MRVWTVAFLLGLYLCGNGQYDPLAKNSFLGREVQEGFDYWNISRPSYRFHSSFRPYLSSTYREATDSVLPFKFYGFRNFFLSKTFNESPQHRNWFSLQLHPIIDLTDGYDLLSASFKPATMGGMHLKFNVNDDFTFAFTMVGGQTQLPFYLDTTIQQQRILPEYGQAYGRGNYHYSDYTGYISYTTRNKVFNFQAGRDKHFIGDGYRSVLLSDYAPAYPYFKITTNIWHLQYSVWYAWMFDVNNAAGIKSRYTNKYGTFHYLSYNVFKELNIGLFENIVWRGTDTNQVRTFEVNYLNPIIFWRPTEYSIGSPDNSFLGLNVNANLFGKVKLYGQLGLDEFYLKEIRARRGWWANKQAWQLGAKMINAFGIKGLKLQGEYNQVRPYTYTHGLPDQNYAHYGKPLAHPLGANFKELLTIINLRRNKWELMAQGMYVLIGKDTAGTGSNMGQDIFKSYTTRPYEYGHYTGQGVKNNILQGQLQFSYYLVPFLNMRLFAGYIQRSESSASGYQLENPYLYLGLKSSFWHSYTDY